MTNAERVLGLWEEDPRCVAAFDAMQDRRSPTGRLEAMMGSRISKSIPTGETDIKIQEIPAHQKPLGGIPQKPYYDNFGAGKKVSR